MKIQKSHTPATELLSFIAYLQAWLGGWAAEVIAVQKGWTGNKLVQGVSSAWFPNCIGVAISPPSFPLSLSLSQPRQHPCTAGPHQSPFPLSLSLSAKATVMQLGTHALDSPRTSLIPVEPFLSATTAAAANVFVHYICMGMAIKEFWEYPHTVSLTWTSTRVLRPSCSPPAPPATPRLSPTPTPCSGTGGGSPTPHSCNNFEFFNV